MKDDLSPNYFQMSSYHVRSTLLGVLARSTIKASYSDISAFWSDGFLNDVKSSLVIRNASRSARKKLVSTELLYHRCENRKMI